MAGLGIRPRAWLPRVIHVEKPQCLCGPLPHSDPFLREATALFRVKQSESICESLYFLHKLPFTPPVAQGHPGSLVLRGLRFSAS